MRVKVLFVCLLFAGGVCAQVSEGIEKNKVYQGFSGGMMLHTKSRILVMSSAIHSMPRGSISATHWKTTSCTRLFSRSINLKLEMMNHKVVLLSYVMSKR